MNPENDSDEIGAGIVREGAAAFWDDIPLCDNPYHPEKHKQSHRRRADGWLMAKREVEQMPKATKRDKEA